MPIPRPQLSTLALLLSLCMSPVLLAQPIYKVRDADGNIIYTDQKPSDDAEPMDLPELGVIRDDGPELEDLLSLEPDSKAGLDPTIEPLNLIIVHPQDGMQFSLAGGGGVAIELESNIDLPPSAQIVLFINDQPQDPIQQSEIILTGLEAGNYRLHAELQSPSGRLLARTDEISFGIRNAPAIRHSP